MSQLPTPSELLGKQVERVLRLYDRGLLGLDELDAIRVELLDDTAQEAVQQLLQESESLRVHAFLGGEPIPHEEVPESPVGPQDSEFSPVIPTSEPQELVSLDGSSDEESVSKGPIHWAPTMLLLLSIAAVFWGLWNWRVTPVESVEATGGAVIAPVSSGNSVGEEPTAKPVEPVFGLSPREWVGHPMKDVLKETEKQLAVKSVDQWFGSSSNPFSEEVKWRFGTDSSPWERSLPLMLFVGETPIQFRITTLRGGFGDVGPEGGYAIQWTLPAEWSNQEELKNQFPGESDTEGVQGGTSRWCYGTAGKGGVCWSLSFERGGEAVLTVTDRRIDENVRALNLALARPMGRYTEARNAVFGPDADLTKALDWGREAQALFGAVHPRIFHGNTMVNLCRAHLMRGDRSEARLKCQMVVEQSLEPEVRSEALFLLARLSLWENGRTEAKGMIARAKALVRGPKLKREVDLYERFLRGDEWSGAGLDQVAALVGCEKGRALGESWRWLPMEFGFRDESHLVSFGAANGRPRLQDAVNQASRKCAFGNP